MYWNRTAAGGVREEMPLSSISHTASTTTTDTVESVNPGTSTQITSTCCTVLPPPPYHNINLPLGHPSTLTNERGAPPSYEEAIDPNAPPPSYDSLFGRMREARKVSKGIFDFLKNIIFLLLGTIGCTIILGVTIVVPICMMVIGGLYLYDCPQARVRQRQEERDEERIRQSPTQTLINCFMLGWFIIGSMWVYKEYEPNYDPALGKHCNKTLYLFAFWLITSVYICLGVVTAGLCSISVASIAFQRSPPQV
ncbi:PREDICTED: uncharacterized protein LOC106744429 isoform X2 [Dinoponera quadriceps]|uniref:Uncharacterized protein LOC106744429 isoform X2 n=1 Tax=Dinoponera quadriceps TaxID=609295 RepID=A0A6P3X8V1_DINQU|nr:PREDICTED: uncharacterized protein LOC106744429 isoform X2 [Dinoponera quadriceps]